jgi:hypothetical protein
MHELTKDINPQVLRQLYKFSSMSYDKFAVDVARGESKRLRAHLRNTTAALLKAAGLEKSDLDLDKDAIRYEAKVLNKIINNRADEYVKNLPAVIDIGGAKVNRPEKKYGSNTGVGFTPTREQKELVYEYAYSMVSFDTMAGCVINPETGAPITVPTLKKAFQFEISKARAEREAALFKMTMSYAMQGDKAALPALRTLITASRMGYDRKVDIDVEAAKKKEDKRDGHEEIVIDDADYALIQEAYKNTESMLSE